MTTKIALLLMMILFSLEVAAQQQPQDPIQPPRDTPSQPAPPSQAPAPARPSFPQGPPPEANFASPSQEQRPQPATPPQPGTPAQPGTPSARPMPNVPNMPGIPNIPAVPNIPNVPPADPLGDVMFPPDLILGHSRELLLTSEQKSFMRDEIMKTTLRFTELQWMLHDAMEQLHQTLESSSVNDQQALGQLDKVLDIEREIKRLHFGMGIRLKNKLTAEQQAKLQRIRMGRPWAVGQQPVEHP